MQLENTILSHLVFNETYTRRVIPFLKSDYFHDAAEKQVFELIDSYIKKYNSLATREALFIELENAPNLHETVHAKASDIIANLACEDTKLEWLLDTTEGFCQDKAFYNALMKCVSLMDDGQKAARGLGPTIMTDALAVSFDNHIGHDYFEDAENRYANYHKIEDKVPFDIKLFNLITKGGVSPGTLNVILAGTHVGKAQPLSAKIPTPFGWKTMGQLRVGDFVFGSNGKPTMVTGVFPQGKKKVYKIIFDDGREARCCQEHLWNVIDSKGRVNTMSLEEIIVKRAASDHFRKRSYIQLTKPVEYSEQRLLIHPYLMGVFLGDGHSAAGGTSITNVDDEVVSRIGDLVPIGCQTVRRGITTHIISDPVGSSNRMNSGLVFYGLKGTRSWNKSIPPEYLVGSIEQRLDLLRGLMDTDGYIGKNGAVSYTTTSPQLAADVAELVRSLGGWANTKEKQKYYTDKKTGQKLPGRVSYDLHICFDRSFDIVTVQHKLERYQASYRYANSLKLTISDIKEVDAEECQCISVSAADHLYLTDDYIVTHNTLAMTHMAGNNLRDGKNVLYITLEMSEQEITKRIDVNLMDVAFDELMELSWDTYQKKINRIKSKTTGKLKVKEFPTASAGANHFRHVLNELKLKENFVPDIIYIDYLNICCSSRLKAGSAENSYLYVKSVAEEIRGLAQECKLPIITATQTNRSGASKSDLNMDDTSESFGLPMTADLMLGLTTSEELQALGQIMVKNMKNRYNGTGTWKRFVVGVDYTKMRIFDVEDEAQDLSENGAPEEDRSVFDSSSFGQLDNERERKERLKTLWQD